MTLPGRPGGYDGYPMSLTANTNQHTPASTCAWPLEHPVRTVRIWEYARHPGQAVEQLVRALRPMMKGAPVRYRGMSLWAEPVILNPRGLVDPHHPRSPGRELQSILRRS